MDGWVSIHRQITEHWTFKEKRVFSKFEAWMDLILLANHEDNKALIDGELMLIKRGEHLTSIRKLCERWKWSNTKVGAFLELLERDKMIIKKSDAKKTLISLVNYGKFQYQATPKTTEKRQSNDTETTLKHTNNNDNNLNNLNSSPTTHNKDNAFAVYEREKFGFITSTIQEKISSMIEQFTEPCVIKAMEEAVYYGKRYLPYVKQVLDDWQKLNHPEPWTLERQDKPKTQNGNVRPLYPNNSRQTSGKPKLTLNEPKAQTPLSTEELAALRQRALKRDHKESQAASP